MWLTIVAKQLKVFNHLWLIAVCCNNNNINDNNNSGNNNFISVSSRCSTPVLMEETVNQINQIKWINQSNQIKSWFLNRGEKRSTRRKTSWSRVENQQTQSKYDIGSGNQTQDTLVEGERSHHWANPAPHMFCIYFILLYSQVLSISFSRILTNSSPKPRTQSPCLSNSSRIQEQSQASAFWDDYCTIVNILLQFIKAERTGKLNSDCICFILHVMYFWALHFIYRWLGPTSGCHSEDVAVLLFNGWAELRQMDSCLSCWYERAS